MFSRYRGALLSLIAVPISIGVFFYIFLIGGIATAYHPIAPGIHLVPVRFALAAIGVLACIVLAVRHSSEKRRTLVMRNATVLAAVPVSLLIAFQIIAANFQQPDHLRMTYRGDTYSIPRVYSPGQSSEGKKYDRISVSICWKTGEPVYANTCRAVSQVVLSTRPLIEIYNVSLSLDRAGATYDGDVVTSRGRGSGTLADGSFDYNQQGSRIRFLLSKSGQIERFMRCSIVTETCTIIARTPQGILTFPARATDTGATNFWRAEEEVWLAAFDSWKCAEETCSGRFERRP